MHAHTQSFDVDSMLCSGMIVMILKVHNLSFKVSLIDYGTHAKDKGGSRNSILCYCVLLCGVIKIMMLSSAIFSKLSLFCWLSCHTFFPYSFIQSVTHEKFEIG